MSATTTKQTSSPSAAKAEKAPLAPTSAGEQKRPASTKSSARIFVGNLSYRTKWQDLKDYFKKVGNVTYADVLQDNTGRSRGCGIVEFATIEEAEKAIAQLHDTELNGRKIFVREDREPKGYRGVASSSAKSDRVFKDNRKIFVGNLSATTGLNELAEAFSLCGPIDKINVYDGKNTKYALISFAEAASATKAIEILNDQEFQGNKLIVKLDTK